jgi:hypothetical protein
MANTTNIEKELKEIKDAYVKLAECVERLQANLDAIIGSSKQAKGAKGSKASKGKLPTNSKLIEVKKLKLETGKDIEVHVYKNFVIVDGHKRKIYEFKKGKMFNYEGKNVYLKLNTPQAV